MMVMIVMMIISSMSVNPSSLADAGLRRGRNGLAMAPEAGATRMPAWRAPWRRRTPGFARILLDYDLGIRPPMPESSPAGNGRHFGFEIVQRANTDIG
jgi:hypothetical protein